MKILPIFLIVITCFLAACLKNYRPNEHALLQQKACIQSIELGDYPRAQTHCELCLEYERSMSECLNGLGLIALMQKDEERARSFFKKAIRQKNDFSQARNNLGVIYFSNGDFKTALRYFNRALEIDPANLDARYNSGLSYLRIAQRLMAQNAKKEAMQNLGDAKKQITKLLTLEPSYAHGFRDLGIIELNNYELAHYDEHKKDHLTAAEHSFKQCLQIDENSEGCHESLAQVHLINGNFKESFSSYFQCLAFAPQNIACKNGITLAFEKSVQAEGGYGALKESIKDSPDNALAHEAFCKLLFDRGLDQDAIKECQIALRLKPDLCSAHYRLGSYFAARADNKQSARHCKAFLICKVGEQMLIEQQKCQEILAAIPRPR